MLCNFIYTSSNNYKNKIAVISSGNQYTYSTVSDLTSSLALSLDNLGLKKGDKIAFFLSNRFEAILCYLACFVTGITAVPINENYSPAEVIKILNEIKPSLFITEHTLLSKVSPLSAGLIETFHCYIIADSNHESSGFKSFDHLLLPTANDQLAHHIPQETIATVAYSSGSTGKPKAIAHTHAQLYQFMCHHASLMSYSSNDQLLIFIPHSFAYCFSNQILPALLCGATIHLSSVRNYPEIVNKLITEPVTLLYLGPSSLIQILNHIDNTPSFSHSLRAIVSAGQSLPMMYQEKVKKTFGLNIHEGIGMTETWMYAINKTELSPRIGSVGLTCPGIEVKIVSDQGNELPIGKIGEIAVKGYSVSQIQYTDGNFSLISTNEWFNTGDYGHLDADGYLYFYSRKKYLIQKHGSLLSPNSIECLLYNHPAVLEAVVVGQEMNSVDTKIVAYITLVEGHEISQADIFSFLRTLLQPEAMPDEIIFMPNIPKGVTGKVDRDLLMTNYVL